MKRIIGLLVIKITGWKSLYPQQWLIEKSVIIAAPHTSNWDLVHSLAVFWKYNVPLKFFIKDSYTKGLFGWFFRWLGAIGVNRSKNSNLVEHAANIIKEKSRITLMVPAEGSRKRVDKWKTGFYHIAKRANVPVLLGYLDYKNKVAGVGDLVNLTDDFEKDMQRIEDFYRNISGKFPEQYNTKIF